MTSLVKWLLVYAGAFIGGRGVARFGWSFDRVVDGALEALPLLSAGVDPIGAGVASCL